MPSRHLLDPQLAALAEMQVDPSTQMAAEATEMMRQAPLPTSDEVDVREVSMPGRDGAPDVRALLFTPKAAGSDRPAMLHIHGGGYVLGTPEMSAPSNLKVADDFGAVVLSVDYRLAPQTKHPGPVEDCYAALEWLFANAGQLGVDATRIGVSGESAGGGLAAALALLARARKALPLAFQHLIFPMIDDRTVVDVDPSPYVGQYVWTRQANTYGWTSLLTAPPGSPDVSCYAAAARATDLSGLPPTYIACGALDLFIEENLDYARRLIRAGVPTEMHVYPGAPHGFQMVQEADVTRWATRDSFAALGRLLAGGA